MIFGFNTDVKFGDTVYHVQSEARQHEHVLQTQVFVKGRCIGKHASSYADEVQRPDFSEEHLHELLKVQHKRIVEAARQGTVAEHITAPAHHAVPAPPATPAAPTPPAPAPVIAVAPAPPAPAPAAAAPAPAVQSAAWMAEPVGAAVSGALTVECLSAQPMPGGDAIDLLVRVTESGTGVGGAQLTCRVMGQTGSRIYATTTEAGTADVRMPLPAVHFDEISVLLHASFRERSGARTFRLRRAG